MNKFFLIAAGLSILAGCAKAPPVIEDYAARALSSNPTISVEVDGKAVSLEQYKDYIKDPVAPAVVAIDPVIADMKVSEPLRKTVAYTFSARGDIKDVLKLFSETGSRRYVNIVADDDVEGEVDVSFRKLSLHQAMTAILQSKGYYYVESGDLLIVKNMESRLFEIDYPRMVRNGTFNVSSTMSSSSSSSSGPSSNTTNSGSTDSASGSESGADINSVNMVDFWGELSTDIRSMLSDRGALSVNKMAGTVAVKDQHRNVQLIADYIASASESVKRQVIIRTQILRVAGEYNRKFNIDWTRLTNTVIASTGTAITNPFGLATATPAGAINLTLQNNAGTIQAIIDALEEQGDIQVVSDPQIRTLNNQSALIKVGKERTFFGIESTTNTTTAGATTTVNDVQQKITIGLVMSVTPQISRNGYVTMDISPAITSLTGVDQSVSGSTAPIIDVQQLSSMVRVKSGESVVIGGLIESTKSNTERSIPLLGAIPFVGALFRSNVDVDRDEELVIILTPYVVNE